MCSLFSSYDAFCGFLSLSWNRIGFLVILTLQDGTLLLSTVQSQITTAVGLKYRNEETNTIRAVRITQDGLLTAPEGDWGTRVYMVVTMPGICTNTSQLIRAGASTASHRIENEGDNSSKRKADEHPDEQRKRKQTCYRCGGSGVCCRSKQCRRRPHSGDVSLT